METEKIIIANLKCDGCAHTIKTKLATLKGVQQVTVYQDEDAVTIEHTGETNREEFCAKLHELGYPEATEENGLLLQLKSYASCMLGRIHK